MALRIEYSTPLTPRQFEALLEEAIDDGGTNIFGTKVRSFSGKVKNGKFCLERYRIGKNSPLYTASGSIVAANEGSRITAQIGLSIIGKVLMAFGCVPMGFLTCGSIKNLIDGGPLVDSLTLFGGGMFFLGLSMILFLMDDDDERRLALLVHHICQKDSKELERRLERRGNIRTAIATVGILPFAAFILFSKQHP
jgi:hypothetical protein